LSVLYIANNKAAATLFTREVPPGIDPSSNVGYIIQRTPPVDISSFTNTELLLGSCGLNENCFPALAQIASSINKVVLDFNPLGNVGVRLLSQAIQGNKTLSSIHMRNVYMTFEGMSVLSEAIATMENLTVLDIRDNAIGDNGVESLAKSLYKTPTVTELLLSNTGLTDASMPTLCSALSTLERLNTLWIEQNKIDTEESFLRLRRVIGFRKMTHLEIPLGEASSVLFRSYSEVESEPTSPDFCSIHSSALPAYN
jgi:Leucine-rich repeat (LRR) protein